MKNKQLKILHIKIKNVLKDFLDGTISEKELKDVYYEYEAILLEYKIIKE